MTDQDNPYGNIVEAIQSMIDGSLRPSFLVGKVASPYPLSVNVAGLLLERDDMEFNTVLLARNGEVHTGCDYGDEDFESGERLLVLASDDGQTYIAVCKIK